MENALPAILTLSGVVLLASAFLGGYLFGVRHGKRRGRDGAVNDLLMVKDPETWERARFLVVDEVEKAKEEAREKERARISQATTQPIRKP